MALVYDARTPARGPATIHLPGAPKKRMAALAGERTDWSLFENDGDESGLFVLNVVVGPVGFVF